MEVRPFGLTKRVVPVIGQGTWYLEGGDRTAAIAALRVGLDLGMTHIDTAEMCTEPAPSRTWWARPSPGRRDEVFLVSKVLPEHATRRGTPAACERSRGARARASGVE
jgi:diketogulonate reductase-like aldo/keto reductase